MVTIRVADPPSPLKALVYAATPERRHALCVEALRAAVAEWSADRDPDVRCAMLLIEHGRALPDDVLERVRRRGCRLEADYWAAYERWRDAVGEGAAPSDASLRVGALYAALGRASLPLGVQACLGVLDDALSASRDPGALEHRLRAAFAPRDAAPLSSFHPRHR